MGAVAAFNVETFRSRYPEFIKVPTDFISQCFAEAGLYHLNNGQGPVCDATQQLMIMNMVTAHIVKLTWRGNDGDISAGPELVGAITSASQGSVSVSTNEAAAPGTEQWYKQTVYGNNYLMATSAYRLGKYFPRRGRPMGPFWIGRIP